MSTISNVACTSFFDEDMRPRRSTRSSGTRAMPTAVSVVENGCAATTVSAPVSALNRLDFPLLGRPTRPSRSTGSEPTRGYRTTRPATLHAGSVPERHAATEGTMSKKTTKRKLRARRNKANHGKRPNAGRR